MQISDFLTYFSSDSRSPLVSIYFLIAWKSISSWNLLELCNPSHWTSSLHSFFFFSVTWSLHGYADWFETSTLHNDSVALTKINADLVVDVMDYTAQASFRSVLKGCSSSFKVQYTHYRTCYAACKNSWRKFEKMKEAIELHYGRCIIQCYRSLIQTMD